MPKTGLTLIQKVLIAFLIILIPIFIAISALFVQQRNELQSELFGTLERVADEREAYLLLYIEMSKVRIQDFSTDDFIVSALEDIADREASGRALADYIARYKLPLLRAMYRMSVLTAPDGIVLASTAPGFTGRDFSGEEFFLKGRQGLSVVETVRGVEEEPELAFSAPIYSRQDGGRLLGVITGFTPLSKFGELFSGEFIEELGAMSLNPLPWDTMEIYLVNRDKLMITESRFVPDAVLNLLVDTLPVRACLEENREVTGIYEDYRGRETAGASMCLPSLGWTLLAEVDNDEVFQPVSVFQRNIVLLIVVVLLFIGVLVFYFLRIIVAQVRRLMAGATAVAAGDYTIRVPVSTRDEMGALTASFNDMAASIEARTNELRKERETLANSQRIARLGGWEWDIANDIATWSEETYRIFSMDPSAPAPDYAGFLALAHPDDRELLERKVSEALHKGGHYSHEHRIIRADGEERIVHEEAEVELDENGNAVKMNGTVQDITEHRRAERALEESEQRYRTLIENLQEGIIVLDQNDMVIYLNPKMAGMLGYTVQEMMGRRLFEFMDGAEAERASARLERSRRGITESFEVQFMKKDGSLMYAAGAAGPILEKSEYRGVIASIIDVTERKKAEDALKESEERLRAILENMGNPMFMQDMEGRLVYVNNIFLSTLRAEEKDVYGKTIFDIFPPEVAEELHKDDLRAMESDVPIQVEDEIPLPDGIHYAIATKFTLRDKNGNKYAMCGVVTDVTPLKRAEEALRRSEAGLRDAQRIAHLGNFEHDVLTDMLYISDEVYRIFGRKKGELETLADFTGAVHPDDLEMVKEAMKGLLYEARPYSIDYRILRPDREERIVHSEAECSIDKEGRPIRMTGIILDITERKRAEEEVRKLNVELERRVEERTAELKRAMEGLSAANREIETFTYSVAHDLRSPLRLVDGFSMLLVKKQKEKLDKDAQDQIMRIRGAVKRMGELIDDLLNLSYVMRAEITYESVDLSALARSIAGNLVKAEPERVASFHIEEGLRAKGDEKLLKLVLENLMGNAWKFTSKTPAPRIELGVTGRENGMTVFHVRDNGAGFDMKHADRLFHPFQRLHPSDEFPGTGIGLATVQRIIQRHGGRVWAEGEPGRGAVFYFTLRKGDA
ncbi:MAG: PAS domain S-box protein [Deltaproteobacteria bacterium]|nr:PAS domain S-box protein [Deltaproteobacteria bacterium]MBZ0220142.1 PAS domain S-box protein [Deltaproteobacteria bacterium]